MIHKQVSICILQHTANIQRQTATHKHTRVVLFKYICVCALFSVLCKNYVFCISAGQQDYLIVVAADPFSHLNRRRPFAPWSEQTIICLREIRAIFEDNNVFQNIQSVSISTIDRVLKIHHMSKKQYHAKGVMTE